MNIIKAVAAAVLITIPTISAAKSIKTYTVDQSRPFAEKCVEKHKIPQTYQWKQAYFDEVADSFQMMIRWESKDFLDSIKVNYSICHFSRKDGALKPFTGIITIINDDYKWKKQLKTLPVINDQESQKRIEAELQETYYESEPSYDGETQLFYGKDEVGQYIRVHDPEGYEWLTKVIQDGITLAWITVDSEKYGFNVLPNFNEQYEKATSVKGVNDFKLYSLGKSQFEYGVDKTIRLLKEGKTVYVHLRSKGFTYYTKHQLNII